MQKITQLYRNIHWQRYLKIGISLFFLLILFKQVDWQNIYAYKNQIKLLSLLVLLSGLCINILISTFRWKIILHSLCLRVSFFNLAKYYVTGMFWNTFLPSSIGGDGYRILALNRKQHIPNTQAIASVLLDRLYGVGALFVVNFLLTFFYWDDIKSTPVLLGIESTLLSLVFLGILFFLFLNRQDGKILSRLKKYRLARKLQEIWKAIQMVSWRITITGISLSIVFVLVSGLIWWGAYLMFVDIKPLPIIFASVLANISGMLPISVNGIGVSEGVAFYILSKWEVSAESVLGASIVIRLILGVVALLGGLLYLLDSSSE